jgi:hypothetical protein
MAKNKLPRRADDAVALIKMNPIVALLHGICCARNTGAARLHVVRFMIAINRRKMLLSSA